MSRRSGFIGYVDARADRLAIEQASAARRAAIERQEEDAAARAAAAVARRPAPRPKPARQASPADPSVSGAQRAAQPPAPETRTIAKTEYDLLMRAANAVLKKF